MNSATSKTSDPHRILLNHSDKINSRRSDKYITLSNLGIDYTWKNITKLCKNSKFKISAPTWNEKFYWTDGSYSVSDIQDYFEHLIKKYQKVTDNHPIRIYLNITENRITFKKGQDIILNF